MTTLDPWGAVKIDNYSKLFDEFGISRFILGKFSWDEIPGNDSDQLIEFLIQNFDATWLKTHYLFSWDEITLSFPGILIDFLMQNYNIDWVKTAKIEKIDDGRAIKISTEKNYLLLKLNDETTEVNLKIDDGRTDKFIAKMENGKLNIYKAPNIEKSMDKERVTISNGKIFLSLVLNDKKTKVLLTINNGISNEYNVTNENGLFSWDEVPGNDNGRLIEFLTQKFCIDWAKIAKIEKIDDGKTIIVTAGIHFLSLRLNNEKPEVKLKINDGRTAILYAKLESGKLNIYGKLIIDLGKIPNPNRYMRRGVIFGHRSYKTVLDAMLSGKPFGALSGFMPSGKAHLGHKMVMEEIIWHQQQGGDVFLAIANMEAHAVRGKTWEECEDIGKDYILSAIALGLEPGAHIYFQSKSDLVKNLAFELGIKANFSEMSAIYGFNGETNISHMVSALTQSADILHPQLKEFGGPKPVVIPVGADQDPHIRLTRGLADKMNKFHVFKSPPKFNLKFKGMIHIYSKSPTADIMKTEHEFDILEKRLLQEKIVSKKGIAWDDKDDSYNRYTGHIEIACVKSSPEDLLPKVEELTTKVEIELRGYAFKPPASTYHMFMTGLQGGKMSSSIPESYIALTDSPEEGAKKVMRAKTGGRVTLEEQRRLGGQPGECSVYELLLFHLVEDDKELYEEIRDTCVGGSRVCGECKKHAAELMHKFLKEHQEKREHARKRLGEFGLKL